MRVNPDLIVASTTATVAALARQSHTTPIVFTMVSDPVAQGFVTSLARPGGNITGFTAFEFAIGGKWLSILREIAPHLARVLFLNNPKTSPQAPLFLRSIEAAARTLGIAVIAGPVEKVEAIGPTIDDFAREPNGDLIVATDVFLFTHADVMLAAAARRRLPAIYADGSMPHRGGLMSYTTDPSENWRQAADYVDRILKGASPADLPVQEPTRYVFTLNERAAKARGSTSR